jgi:iron complex transport system ATP-binding protein
MYRVEHLRFRYDEAWVLDGLDFSVGGGSFTGLIGPNGSGKTTLLKLLAGLFPAGSGTISLQGSDIRRRPGRERARLIGYVPQESRAVFQQPVLEYVLMGRAPRTPWIGFDRPEDVRVAQAALRKIGIEHLADRDIQDLSGGEGQMARIARALAQQPEVLLLDEPTAFLDLSHQVAIYETLLDLNRTEGLTVLSVSHDLNLAAQYCDHLILLNGGRIAALGAPEAILTEDRIERVYGCRTLVDRHPATGKPRVTLMPSGGKP